MRNLRRCREASAERFSVFAGANVSKRHLPRRLMNRRSVVNIPVKGGVAKKAKTEEGQSSRTTHPHDPRIRHMCSDATFQTEPCMLCGAYFMRDGDIGRPKVRTKPSAVHSTPEEPKGALSSFYLEEMKCAHTTCLQLCECRVASSGDCRVELTAARCPLQQAVPGKEPRRIDLDAHSRNEMIEVLRGPQGASASEEASSFVRRDTKLCA